MRESHRDYHKSATKLIKELGISGWDAQAILTDPENEIRNYKDTLGYIGLIKQAEAWEAHERSANPRRRKAKRNTGDPVKQKVQSMFPILPEIDLWSIGTKYELRCPKCGAIELHPWIKDSLTIRGFKVTDEEGRAWSQCLVCAKYYDKKTLELTPEKYEPSKGWFTLD